MTHEFTLRMTAAAPCTLESGIDGFTVHPANLPSGHSTVALKLDAMPGGTLLRGLLLIRTQQLTRRVPVSGLLGADGIVGNGQLLWHPEEEAESAETMVWPDLELAPTSKLAAPALDIELIREAEDQPTKPIHSVPLTPKSGGESSPATPSGGADVADASLVVSPFGAGAYRTIGEALRVAAPARGSWCVPGSTKKV